LPSARHGMRIGQKMKDAMTEAKIMQLRIEYLEAENERLKLRIENMMWWSMNSKEKICQNSEKKDDSLPSV
jgi:L,D-peptidoglycan transpeptidase YkuD (ErfK/YbiS/YcfS/YnhG family)